MTYINLVLATSLVRLSGRSSNSFSDSSASKETSELEKPHLLSLIICSTFDYLYHLLKSFELAPMPFPIIDL